MLSRLLALPGLVLLYGLNAPVLVLVVLAARLARANEVRSGAPAMPPRAVDANAA